MIQIKVFRRGIGDHIISLIRPTRHSNRADTTKGRKMLNYIKLIVLGLVVLFAMMGASFARDLAYQVHMILIMAVAGGLFIWTLRRTDEPALAGDLSGEYNDGVIRAGVIATCFWGIAGFLVGVIIAFQLAWPQLNFEWAQGYANFGRLRPLHTSAVIFAFGGNALIASSLRAWSMRQHQSRSPSATRSSRPSARTTTSTTTARTTTWRPTARCASS